MPVNEQHITEYGNSAVKNMYSKLTSNIDLQKAALGDIELKNKELIQKQNIQIQQLKEIEDKEKLLLTRSRMLQIAQDRNSYKKKIIYSLIALIFAIFIFTLVMYIFFRRKLSSVKMNGVIKK
jgi:hypothetical protein